MRPRSPSSGFQEKIIEARRLTVCRHSAAAAVDQSQGWMRDAMTAMRIPVVRSARVPTPIGVGTLQ
jgi:hypothetical protein